MSGPGFVVTNHNDIYVPSGIPSPSGNIRFDTRSGGSQDIQDAGVTTLAQAFTASGFHEYTSQNGGVLAFTTDADGAGSHAFRTDWPGVASSTEVHTGIAQSMGSYGITTSDIYLQWKIWQTKTTSGGGIGTAGDWDAYSQGPGSGKRLVWYRVPGGAGTDRITFAPGSSADYLGQYFIEGSYNPTKASIAVNWDNYVSQWITLTFRFVPESSAGAGDGTLEGWFNETKIKSIVGTAFVGASGFVGELQIGGPTWIGVPQDQTMYIKDVVIWQP